VISSVKLGEQRGGGVAHVVWSLEDQGPREDAGQPVNHRAANAHDYLGALFVYVNLR
jgi:hypothetical protein